MFAKLLFILLMVIITAATLLVIRQQRLECAHEASQLHRRLERHERSLWKLQSEIAARCRPGAVRSALDQLGGEWVPIPGGPVPEPTTTTPPTTPPPRPASDGAT